MSKSVLVSYLERNKKIEIPDSKSRRLSDVQYIESVFKSVFSFDRNVKLCITLQRFDTEWNEFVDLEVGDEINHKDKLKAVVSPLLNTTFEASSVSVSAITPSPSYQIPSDSMSPRMSDINALFDEVHEDDDEEDGNDIPPTQCPSFKRNNKRPRVIIHSDSNDSGSEERLNESYKREKVGDDKESIPEGTPKLPFDEKQSLSSEGSISKVKKLDKDKDVVLPYPFPFPKNFPPGVDVAIRTGEVGKSARNRFLSSVLHAVYSYKRYPSERDFCNISTQIMERFPNFYSSQDALIEIMKSKMKEIRRPKNLRSQKAGKSSDSTSKEGRSLVLHKAGKSPGSVDLMKLPPIPAGEDEVSFQRHNRVLRAEFAKAHHNKQIVSELMSITFSMRRADILQSPCDINSILEKYPFLQTDFLLNDFSLICSHVSVNDDFTHKLSACIPVIFKSAEVEAKTSSSFSNVFSDVTLSKAVGNNSNDDLLNALMLLIYLIPDSRTKVNTDLLFLFTEGATDVSLIAQGSDNKHPFVIIIGSLQNPQQAFLVVDKVVVKETDICSILKLLLAAFYVFNICYPRGLVNFYTFFDVLLLNMNPKKVAPSVKLLLGKVKS